MFMFGRVRSLVAHVVLVAIGLPALFGHGLHWGQAGCCHSVASKATSRAAKVALRSRCCHDCPWGHAKSRKHRESSALAATDAKSVIRSLNVCRVCEFLALAKDVDRSSTAERFVDTLIVHLTVSVESRATSIFAHSLPARGPPIAG